MRVKIEKSKLKGSIYPPVSKSWIQRAIICSFLSGSVPSYPLYSKDIEAMMECMNGLVLGKDLLDAKESGATLRFMIPQALLTGREICFTGAPRLFERPLDVYEKLAEEENFLFEKGKDYLKVKGLLQPKEYFIDGAVSSQFVSGLCMALPLLPGCSVIHITGGVTSRPYIELTKNVMEKFGVKISWADENCLVIPGNQKYVYADQKPEGDYTQAAYLGALNRLGSEVKILGLEEDSLQGDKDYDRLFDELIQKGHTSIVNHPDLGPILMAISWDLKRGAIEGLERLQYKESDRVTSMIEELVKMGTDEPMDSHQDHRIVMALSILGTKYGCVIEGAEAVEKSFPDFFEYLKQLGAKLTFTE